MGHAAVTNTHGDLAQRKSSYNNNPLARSIFWRMIYCSSVMPSTDEKQVDEIVIPIGELRLIGWLTNSVFYWRYSP